MKIPTPSLTSSLALGLTILALSTSAAHANGDSTTWTESSNHPPCRRVEKYRLVEKPRHNVVKEKTVLKDCCRVEKHFRKMKNGVLVKDRPVSRRRHCGKHYCS